jgi:hypothetical protein
MFFNFIRSGYVEPWKPESHEQNRIVMGIVANAAATYAAAGYFTIVDGIIIPAWFLAPMRDSLRAAGHPAAYAVLRAPLDTCVSRARSRTSQALADPDVVERLWHDFADLGRWEPNAIDIGMKSAPEAAELLTQRLRAGLLAI